jgi:Cd2+/Zn2+-exporting ATPase
MPGIRQTGTLTEGRPRITDVIPVGGTQIEDLLNVAIAVESMSDHPLAGAAIVRDGEEMIGTAPIQAKNMSNMIGRGVRAELDGQFVWIGKVEMFGTNGIPALSKAALEAAERLRQSGRTTMVVRRADKDLGAIGLLDTPEGAKRHSNSERWASTAWS